MRRWVLGFRVFSKAVKCRWIVLIDLVSAAAIVVFLYTHLPIQALLCPFTKQFLAPSSLPAVCCPKRPFTAPVTPPDVSAAPKKDPPMDAHQKQILIGKGEQGVLLVEPYKSEILPHWKFKTPEMAPRSADKIYTLFLNSCIVLEL